jgi:hypothetical protein
MKSRTRILSFNRISKVEFFDLEERLSADGNFERKVIDLILQMASTGSLLRSPGDLRPLNDLFDAMAAPPFVGAFPDVFIQFTKWLHDQFAGPYRLNLVNKLNESVQFVWAYERWDGLILVEESTYTAPGATAILIPTPFFPCPLMRQYAVSVWDQNDEEIGQIPTLTVQYINQIEAQKGTWRMCEDTIEIG